MELFVSKVSAQVEKYRRELLANIDAQEAEILSSIDEAHARSLMWDYKNRYFRTNTLLNLPALVVGFISSLIAVRMASGPTFAVIAIIVLMVLVLVVFAIIMRRPTGLGRRLLDDRQRRAGPFIVLDVDADVLGLLERRQQVPVGVVAPDEDVEVLRGLRAKGPPGRGHGKDRRPALEKPPPVHVPDCHRLSSLSLLFVVSIAIMA